MKKNVLFLCTGNSCRSQMAEGLAKTLKGDSINFYSAGTKQHGLNPKAVKVMQEIGIDISGYRSKTIEALNHIQMDFVFTVCSDAHESCPIFSNGQTIHIGFDDPPTLTKNWGDEEKILDEYRRVRDEIKEFISKIDIHMDGKR